MGTWKKETKLPVYHNPEHQLKISFPDAHWHIYTKPDPSQGTIYRHWKRPESSSHGYHLLMASFPGIHMQLLARPGEGGAEWESNLHSPSGFLLGSNHLIISTAKGKKGTYETIKLIAKHQADNGTMMVTYAILVKDGNRVLQLQFNTLEEIYEKHQREFLAVVDPVAQSLEIVKRPN
jgi:hypothetical protein